MCIFKKKNQKIAELEAMVEKLTQENAALTKQISECKAAKASVKAEAATVKPAAPKKSATKKTTTTTSKK